MENTCVKCGNPLEKPKTGRPPSYCSSACRRSAEYELRRLQKHIEKLETRKIELSVTSNCTITDWHGRDHPQQLADCVKNIAELETRLRLLLEDSTDD
jgi:hypothetical protein